MKLFDHFLIDMIRCMRPSFMIGFVVAWNLLGFVAIRVNGVNDGHIHSYAAGLLMSLDCLLLALTGIGTLRSFEIRRIVLRPDAELELARPGLRFIGGLGTFIALILPFAVHA